MQYVIDLPEEDYMMYAHNEWNLPLGLVDALQKAVVLPVGHGRLVDYDNMKELASEYGLSAESLLSYLKPKTVIEADNGGEEDV